MTTTAKTDEADAIVQELQIVAAERASRFAQPGLAARVQALKRYQQERFRLTYADLLAAPRYRDAVTFFLEELYGPRDFEQRDAQFMRIVPAVRRMFPQEIVQTVANLASLHALSEALDTEMGRQLSRESITASNYAAAWQSTGRPEAREKQILLTLAVGQSLERYTRLPMIRTTLRMMRGPARAAGMSELQRFLETGFDTFKAMRGADHFLDCIATRERALATTLFQYKFCRPSDRLQPARHHPLGQLP